MGDMIAHLVWFAETYGGMMERGLRGDLSPTPGFPESGTLKGEETGDGNSLTDSPACAGHQVYFALWDGCHCFNLNQEFGVGESRT